MKLEGMRKGIGYLVATALACSALCAVPAMACADEGGSTIVPMHNEDTDFHFDLDFWNVTAGSSVETKNNDSSTYVKFGTIAISAAQMYVDGGYPGGELVNCMGGADAVINPNLSTKTQYCIRNLVYERFGGRLGYADSQLTAWGMGNQGKISGDWSPDSLRSDYTPLNGYCNPNIW